MECRRRCSAAQHRTSTCRRLSSPIFSIVSLVAILVLADAVPASPTSESRKSASGDATLQYTMAEEQPVGSLVANLLTDTKLEAALSSAAGGSGLVFEVFEGVHSEYFTVESPSGRLRVGKIIDREVICYKKPVCNVQLDVALKRPLALFRVRLAAGLVFMVQRLLIIAAYIHR
jgi:hypothetical protein